MTAIDTPLVLGEGILTWPPAERELGRFGTVCLRMPNTDWFCHFDAGLGGAVVRLSFTVIHVRTAALVPPPRLGIGELVSVRTGEEIDLGVGALFTVDLEGLGPVAVGVLPTEQHLRPDQWLDPVGLYRAQNQLGRLTAHPYRGRRPSPYPTPAPA